MPSTRAHLKQATHNEKLLNEIDLVDTGFIDWAVTISFYTALHFIEAHLGSRRIHSSFHPDRDKNVTTHLPGIYDEYFDLKNDSIEARYKMHKFSKEDFVDNIKPNLETIKAYVHRYT